MAIEARGAQTSAPHALPRHNWAGNVEFSRARSHRPTSLPELQELLSGNRQVRVLGTGHSFNTIADTPGTQVSVAALPPVLVPDHAAGTVMVSAGMRFSDFAPRLHEVGLALHNLGSLPHISLAGACATGTHGSGTSNPAIAAAVRSLDLVTADGSLRTFQRGTADFPGSVVSLGLLGAVVAITLDTVPAYDVRQRVFTGLPYPALHSHLEEILSCAYSVSVFTDWRDEQATQIWIKQRALDGAPVLPRHLARHALPAAGPCHPIPGVSARHSTDQSGEPGPWYARLPHFRPDFVPSSGHELQSEYFVAAEQSPRALEALHRVRDRIAPALQISELRSVAADDQWLSPAHRRSSTAFHFTWHPHVAEATRAVQVVEEALAPFDARPHWGKVFAAAAADMELLYPRLTDFRRLVNRLDPTGKFRNAWTDSVLPGFTAEREAQPRNPR